MRAAWPSCSMNRRFASGLKLQGVDVPDSTASVVAAVLHYPPMKSEWFDLDPLPCAARARCERIQPIFHQACDQGTP
ncbi:hypothetical protein WDV93_14045 [Pantoea ananatis]